MPFNKLTFFIYDIIKYIKICEAFLNARNYNCYGFTRNLNDDEGLCYENIKFSTIFFI